MIEHLYDNLPLAHLLAILLIPASTALALLGWVLFAVRKGDVQHMVVQAMGMRIEFTQKKGDGNDNTDARATRNEGRAF